MIYRKLLVAAGAILALGSLASPLTPQQALERVKDSDFIRKSRLVGEYAKPVFTASTQAGNPAAYVFNNAGGGYMVLSGDDMAIPILGYSENGCIDRDNMPPALVYWLNEYADQIEWAYKRNVDVSAVPRRVEGRKAISPLVKSNWNQDSPYNNACPKYNGMLTVTGCVATSMAQVMNYFKYPEVGEGTISYTSSSIKKRLVLNLDSHPFDWSNMLDAYESGQYSDKQADAVAFLMKACGYSVSMDYGTDVSGAQGFTIGKALKDYFKYDQDVRSVYRIGYSSSEWDDMVYDNLANIGPLVMNGQSPLQGGHSFVCDGYDGEGYFHFNWGWGGISDGYYALEALNPDAQGIGGASGGFNFTQNAVFGIQPPTGKPSHAPEPCLFQFGSAIGTINGRVLSFGVTDYNPSGWGNMNYDQLSVNIGAIIEPEIGGNTLYVQGAMGSMTTLTMNQMAYYNTKAYNPIVTLPELADGVYKITLACRPAGGDDSKWMPVEKPYGMVNYVLVNVKSGNYTVKNVAPAVLQFSDVRNLTELYAGKNILFSAEVENKADIEITQGLSPHLFDSNGVVRWYGESLLMTVKPGEKVTKEFVSKFYNSNGGVAYVSEATAYTMKFFNPQTQLYYDDIEVPVVLLPNPGNADLMLTGFNFKDAKYEERTVYGRYFPMIAIFDSPMNLNAMLSFKVKSGYFDGAISFSISRQNPDSSYGTLPVLNGIHSQMEFLSSGQTADVPIEFSFGDAVQNTVYFLVANSYTGSGQKVLGSIPFIYEDQARVNEFTYDENDVITEYFNMQGVRISEPKRGEVVLVKRGLNVEKIVY